MKKYTCPMCGEKINAKDNLSYITCNACGAISKIGEDKNQEQNPQQVVNNNFTESGINPVSLLDWGYLALADGDFLAAEEFFERVLGIQSRNRDAYLGKLLAKERLHQEADLIQMKRPLDDETLFCRAVEFLGEARSRIIRGYNEQIIENLEMEAKDKILSRGTDTNFKNWSPEELLAYEKEVKSLVPYKNAQELLGFIRVAAQIKIAEKETQRIKREKKQAAKLIQEKKAKKREIESVFFFLWECCWAVCCTQ